MLDKDLTFKTKNSSHGILPFTDLFIKRKAGSVTWLMSVSVSEVSNRYSVTTNLWW